MIVSDAIVDRSNEAVPNSPGIFICLVGPSGAGKDTLLALARAALGADPDFLFARRLVTRPAGPFEDHDSIDDKAFRHGVANEAFALSWEAHGLGYAIPGDIREEIRRGRVVIANLSRRAIADARRHFPRIAVAYVTAPPAIIAARLAARGREGIEAIDARLSREAGLADMPSADITIVNDSTPEAAAGLLIDFLNRQRPTNRGRICADSTNSAAPT